MIYTLLLLSIIYRPAFTPTSFCINNYVLLLIYIYIYILFLFANVAQTSSETVSFNAPAVAPMHIITYGPHKAVAEVSNHNEPIGRGRVALVRKSIDVRLTRVADQVAWLSTDFDCHLI